MHPSYFHLSTILPLLHLIPCIHTSPALPPTKPTPNSNSLTFLPDIHCYHLSPTSSISLTTCQPLFAYLVSNGHVYTQHWYWNGWRFKKPGNDPCMIAIRNADEEKRIVRSSIADVIAGAMRVLRECEMGGVEVGEGGWGVGVSRGYIQGAGWGGRRGRGREEIGGEGREGRK